MARKFDPAVMTVVEATDRTTLMQFSAHDRPPFAHEPGKDGRVVWLGDGKDSSPYSPYETNC